MTETSLPVRNGTGLVVAVLLPLTIVVGVPLLRLIDWGADPVYGDPGAIVLTIVWSVVTQLLYGVLAALNVVVAWRSSGSPKRRATSVIAGVVVGGLAAALGTWITVAHGPSYLLEGAPAFGLLLGSAIVSLLAVRRER